MPYFDSRTVAFDLFFQVAIESVIWSVHRILLFILLYYLYPIVLFPFELAILLYAFASYICCEIEK